jgi:hypothetical protein
MEVTAVGKFNFKAGGDAEFARIVAPVFNVWLGAPNATGIDCGLERPIMVSEVKHNPPVETTTERQFLEHLRPLNGSGFIVVFFVQDNTVAVGIQIGAFRSIGDFDLFHSAPFSWSVARRFPLTGVLAGFRHCVKLARCRFVTQMAVNMPR